MDIKRRIETFSLLGDKINSLSAIEKYQHGLLACAQNPWFTIENIDHAFDGIAHMLQKEQLEKWTDQYALNIDIPKIVGIAMAGNIPMVGFHDLLTVLISGNYAAIKTSSKDTFLINLLINWIIEIEPGFKKNISIRDRLTGLDAVIATGSDNTSRYFEYYFKDIPHLIRKNRTSVAILTGNERDEDLQSLGKDIFWYFGLGCRNVSKVFIPKDYDPRKLFEALQVYSYLRDNHKYNNNYEYYKSIFLINKIDHLDTGFMLWLKTSELVSPISVLYSETYENEKEVKNILDNKSDKIQCIVGSNQIPFGQAQTPNVWDYADNVDTLQFLNTI